MGAFLVAPMESSEAFVDFDFVSRRVEASARPISQERFLPWMILEVIDLGTIVVMLQGHGLFVSEPARDAPADPFAEVYAS